MLTENIVYIGLGANQGHHEDMLQMLDRATRHISALHGCRLLNQSTYYFTEPQNYSCQPWFANSVLELAVQASWWPEEFLDAMLTIERRLGRQRGPNRFGPRAIDMDLLLFGHIELSGVHCILPHPRMHMRAFVLWPLREIAPDIRIHGIHIDEWLSTLCFRVDGHKIFQTAVLDCGLANKVEGGKLCGS